MTQLLIVDDEPLVQIGIRSMLNWENLGIEIAGTASNGKQAYDIILEKQPQIVITDIKMPIMDGMQLIESCQELPHPPLFILLTSYEEFQLVRQAISYQVLDYLVKLELTEEILTAPVKKALMILEKEKKISLPPKNAVSDFSVFVDNFYIRLLLNLFETEEQFENLCSLLSIRFDSAAYAVGYLKMANTRQSESLLHPEDTTLFQSSYEMMKSLIAKYLPCHILFLDTTHFAIIFQFEKDDLDCWKARIEDAVNQTCRMLYNYYSIEIMTAIGSLVSNPREISSSYSDCRQIFEETPHAGKHLMFIDDMPDSAKNHNVFHIAIFKDELQKAFSEYDSKALAAVMNDIIELFHNDSRHYAQALSAASNVLHLVLSYLNNGENLLNQIFSESSGYNCLYEAENVPQIMQWMSVLRDGLCRLFSEHQKDYKNRTISSVKKYINEHVEEKITLNQVADIFSISPNYLSILFSKYNDMGFVDYINHAKIERAKLLLSEGTMKVYEISDKLGYESAFYFSRVFKKIEGVSPREYSNSSVTEL